MGRLETVRNWLGALVAMALAASSIAVVVTGAPASAVTKPVFQITGRASVSSSGAQSAGPSEDAAITPDGRYVAFRMTDPAAYPAAGSFPQIFRRDQWTGQVVLVSVAYAAGQTPNNDSIQPSISDDGQYIAFTSDASNLMSTPTGGFSSIFLRDMNTNTTRLISVSSAGDPADEISQNPSIDGAGDKVAFDSNATNLVSGDTNAATDVFVRSWISQTTTRASVGSGGTQANAGSDHPSLSGDGNWVGFSSTATNLVSGDTNGHSDVFERQVSGGSTVRVSLNGATQANGDSMSAALDNDGGEVAFASHATNLVSGDSNGHEDTFRWTRSNKAISRVSLNAFGGQIALGSGDYNAISRDGNVVAWLSVGNDVTLPAGDGTNENVYTRNIGTSFTRLISADATGAPGNGYSYSLAVDQTGQRVAYEFYRDHLVRNDTNATYDVFVTDTNVTIGPFSSLSAFITQQYQDFVGRAPTAAELTEATAQLMNGEYSPRLFIAKMATTGAWATLRGPLLRLYWAFFLREPDQGGYNYWLGIYQSGGSLATIAQKFAQSPEFKTTYGSLSNTAFVKLVYANVLGRQPDAGGLAYWVDQLTNHGLTRGSMMIGFSESPEGRTVLAPQVDTLLINLGMLRAVPTVSFFNTWRTNVGSPAVPSILTAYVLDSAAYTGRFP